MRPKCGENLEMLSPFTLRLRAQCVVNQANNFLLSKKDDIFQYDNLAYLEEK